MEVGCACSEMEVGAVFSFDTGTDNSLGKRATSSIYLSMYRVYAGMLLRVCEIAARATPTEQCVAYDEHDEHDELNQLNHEI